VDIFLNSPAAADRAAIQLWSDSIGHPGHPLTAVLVTPPLEPGIALRRIPLAEPVLLKGPQALHVVLFWPPGAALRLGESRTLTNAAHVAPHTDYAVSSWSPWPDYAFSIGLVLAATPPPLATATASASVRILRHASGFPDTTDLGTIVAAEFGYLDAPPRAGIDLTYIWRDSAGFDLCALDVPYAAATALAWELLEGPTGPVPDTAEYLLQIENRTATPLDLSFTFESSWLGEASGSPPAALIHPGTAALDAHSSLPVNVTFIADPGSSGAALCAIWAGDLSPFGARPVAFRDTLRIGATGINEAPPRTLHITPPYPNPANAAIRISLPVPCRSVEIFNLLGQCVSRITPDPSIPSVVWPDHGSEFPSGVYLIRLQSADTGVVFPVTLLR